MSYSTTSTSTFTRSSARHIASKVASDLGYFQILYDQPTDEKIQQYDDELTELLVGGYVDRVTYGFRRDGEWIAAMRYEARLDGTIQSDDVAGKLRSIMGKNVTGAEFSSFLVTNRKWDALTEAEKEAVRARLPFRRTSGTEPTAGSGYWATDRSYASGSGGVSRSVLKSY